MKTLYTLVLATLAFVHAHAQEESKHDQLSKGLELIGSPRNDYSQYRNLNRFNYWNSRFDRYWSKYEKIFDKDFSARILRATRNLSTGRNDWRGDRYSTQNRKELKRSEGLIKIN